MNEIGDELVALRDKKNIIHAERVVDWAKVHEESALHREFNWNVDEAARQHWLSTARRLIAVHVVDVDMRRTTISLTIDRARGGGYRPLDDVLSNETMRRFAVEQALAELLRWADRHSHLNELEPIFRSIRRAVRQQADAPAPKPRRRLPELPGDRPSA